MAMGLFRNGGSILKCLAFVDYIYWIGFQEKQVFATSDDWILHGHEHEGNEHWRRRWQRRGRQTGTNCPLNQGNSKLQVTNQRNCSLWTQIFYSGRVGSIEWDDLLYHKVSRNSATIKLVKGYLLLPCLEITRSLEILNLKRPTSHTM